MPNHTTSQAQGLVTTDNSATPPAAPIGRYISISPPQPRSTSRPVNGVSAAMTRNASVGPAANCPLVQPVAASSSGNSAGKGVIDPGIGQRLPDPQQPDRLALAQLHSA